MPLFTVFVKGTLSSLIPLNEVGSKKNAWLPRRSEWIALTCTRSLTFLSSKAVWLHIWLSGYHMGFLSVLTQVCTMHSLCAVCTGQSTSTKIMPYYSPFNSSRSRLVLVLLSFFWLLSFLSPLHSLLMLMTDTAFDATSSLLSGYTDMRVFADNVLGRLPVGMIWAQFGDCLPNFKDWWFSEGRSTSEIMLFLAPLCCWVSVHS